MEAKEISLEEVKSQVKNATDAKKNEERMQLIVFRLGAELYALPIDDIKEVVITPGIAKIPQTPPYIKGVANIRGNIIAIMDLEEKFNLISENKTGLYTLVLESKEYRAGILVSDVPNTLTVYKSDIESSKEVMQYSALNNECIVGIVKSQKDLIILIDINKMMNLEEISNISKI